MKVVTINDAEFEREMQHLNRNLNTLKNHEGDRAMAKVLNDKARIISREGRKGTAKAIGIPQKHIKHRFNVTWKANRNNLRVQVAGSTRPINAYRAGAKLTETGMRKGPYEWEGAFLTQSESGHTVAVMRKTRKRYRLKAAEFGKSFVAKEVSKAMDRSTKHEIKDFPLDLHREMSKRMDRLLA